MMIGGMIMSKMSRFLRRLRTEAGDSVAMFIITSLPLLLFITGWSIDYTKNTAVQSDLSNIAQESASAAVRSQQGDGSLQCGQNSSYEAKYKSTPMIVARGLTDIQNLAKGDFSTVQGVSGSDGHYTWSDGSTFYRDSAESIMILASTYLQKTGRSSSTSSVYNGDSSASVDGTSTSVSAGNDSLFVKNMRSFVNPNVEKSADNNSLEKDYGYSRWSDSLNGINHGDGSSDQHFFYNGITVDSTGDDIHFNDSLNPTSPSTYMNNNETLVMAITCYRGISNTGSSSHNEKTIGSGTKFTTIGVDIRDWSSNFTMGMFNRDWDVQRYRLTARATSAWSGSSVS
jgi:hypothetical protein